MVSTRVTTNHHGVSLVDSGQFGSIRGQNGARGGHPGAIRERARSNAFQHVVHLDRVLRVVLHVALAEAAALVVEKLEQGGEQNESGCAARVCAVSKVLCGLCRPVGQRGHVAQFPAAQQALVSKSCKSTPKWIRT